MDVATLSHVIRLFGSDDRGSPVSPESVYNLIYGDPGWIVIRIADATIILLAPDGSALEVR